ncbi:MAG: glycosyltransferase [Treponema sp.]|nr:glycosyltransferase [Treponema sp.]MCI7567549.1 glycosyltransferase [Treponema sp.]
MKIVFCYVKYTAGRKEFGINEWEERYWIEPFRKNGHEVFIFDMTEYLSGPGLCNKQDNGELLQFVEKIKPDFVFMNDYSNDTFIKENWIKIGKICKTVNWFGDDNQRYDYYTKNKASCFTNPITCDFFAIEKYHKDGYSTVRLNQWGSMNFDDIKSEYVDLSNADVTFIGTKSPYRAFIYNTLKNAGIKCKFFGNGWETNKVTLGQMKYIFENSKINLSLEKAAPEYDIRYLISYPRLFLSLLKRKMLRKEVFAIPKQIKARNFEINACKGFQLCQYIPFIEYYFEIGKEIACFTNCDDLIQIINYWLNKDKERALIKENGYKRCKEEHLMEHRLKMMINQIYDL